MKFRKKVEEELKCFQGECDWVIAKDIDDAWVVWCDHLGETREDYEDSQGWIELPMDKELSMFGADETDPDKSITKTVKEWITSEGRGFLMSTEF